MPLRAIDTATDTTGKAHELQAHGIQAVAFYLRADRASGPMIRGLGSVGIKRISIWERGNPTSAGYFSASKAQEDAAHAVAFAEMIKQPEGSLIFPTVDFDATPAHLDGAVGDYLVAFHDWAKRSGYLIGTYGNGLVCQWALDRGYSQAGWLAMSRGWGGYKDFEPHAAIVQTVSATVCGISCDLDDVVDAKVCW